MNYAEYLNWDDQVERFIQLAKTHEASIKLATNIHPLVLLRDWEGRLHLCVPGDPVSAHKLGLKNFIEQFHNDFSAVAWHADQRPSDEPATLLPALETLAVFQEDSSSPDIWDSPDLVFVNQPTSFNA
jgi:hypothetical protein